MRFLLATVCFVSLLSSLPAQAAHLTLTAKPAIAEAEAVVYFADKSLIGARLFEVVKASSLFEEVKNMYVEPGTSYRSRAKGIAIIRDSHGGVELTITMTKADTGLMVSGTNALIVNFYGKNDLGSVLHQTLLTSSSRHVLTKDRPSDYIKPQGDEAVMLSEISFFGEYISCGTYRAEGDGKCSISLNRQ